MVDASAVAVGLGESCLGGYVCEESVERRRSCTCPCACASMSRFADVAIAPPFPLASSSSSSPPSSMSEEERKSGSRSDESGWSDGRATPAVPPALTIESMSQNWTTFMNIGKRPIVLWDRRRFLIRIGRGQDEGTRTRRLGQYLRYLTNSATIHQSLIICARKGGELRGVSWK